MTNRIVFLDYMRVIACFMVIMVHSCEFFFIDGPNIGIRTLDDGFWVCVFDSAFRCSVPLFVLISAYLLVPVTGSVGTFFKKRLLRVVIPFIIWSLLYATLPYLRSLVGDIYGECYWNEYNLLWYFSGFLGYVVLAYCIRHQLCWSVRTKILVGIATYLIGYAITGTIWYSRIETAQTLQQLELSWRFCTPNVILESFGAFILIDAIFSKVKQHRVITELSNLSYGIYLMHIFILGAVYRLFAGLYSTPVTILIVGTITFILCVLTAKCISYLPKSKYLIG